MGDQEGHWQRSFVGCMIALFRLPIGAMAAILVVLFFMSWLVLETAIAIAVFPFASIFGNQAWIGGSWLGRFPIAIRELSRDRFRNLRAIWRWVIDPGQTIGPESPQSQTSPWACGCGLLIIAVVVAAVAAWVATR